MRFREMKLRKNPNCPVCGDNPTVTELIDYQMFCGVATTPAGLPAEERITPQRSRHDPRAKATATDHSCWMCASRTNGTSCIWTMRTSISVNTLAGHLDELPRDQSIVVYCKTGGRSARALQLLKDAGFRNVRNMDGGITRWATEVDTSLPTY